MKNVLLMILDGWGEGKHDQTNAIYTAGQPHIDKLKESNPNSTLSACGEDVGLPRGQMGNSEVGHLNIGAGRIVYQDLVKINRACRDGSIRENSEVKDVYQYVKTTGKALHLMGLVSEGGVHSSMEHLFAFLDIAAEYGLTKVFVHCLMDGRDTDPFSGKGYVEKLQKHLDASTGKIASVIGRYYTMDRDKRWDRVKAGYDLIVHGKGMPFADAADGIEQSYKQGVTDEFIKPVVCVDGSGIPVGTLEKDDALIFFNFRNDRAREITRVLTQENMPEHEMYTIPLYYCCLTPYDDTFKGLHILFDKEKVKETKRKILDFLIQAKRNGKSVAGYGAPGKGNTLLYYCGVRTDFIDYTVDMSPHKQGNFLPGTHIPILHPNTLKKTKPDYVFILPWNLKEEIMEQHKYIRDWEGKFVIPIPELTVLN